MGSSTHSVPSIIIRCLHRLPTFAQCGHFVGQLPSTFSSQGQMAGLQAGRSSLTLPLAGRGGPSSPRAGGRDGRKLDYMSTCLRQCMRPGQPHRAGGRRQAWHLLKKEVAFTQPLRKRSWHNRCSPFFTSRHLFLFFDLISFFPPVALCSLQDN